ncbi:MULTISPECIES: aromatic ring-hydroxylating dioxygenase subunit alpha [unclassified Novosphingobium]|uniref:aromatic ring-hydroxylating oxygenase subunit alpha n=1 Tax=unclassified Novosphingobium TaxID=2644732 RepID=UPI0025F84C90|nr:MULTISPECIES: aromatic ring-hydroxylating dioxygenase subunit alpha [unclassified Novosphingobium]HQV01982.1 aromatic ring-hydroxylating dioxygenase subunit alpha [Novosphingobium sp.]
MNDLSWAATQLAARKPDHSLPQGLYTDPRAFDFDLDAIYARSWLMAGLECELPTAGSRLALTIGKWPVLIVRDKTGEIRAFHNSCSHRGSILCEAGHGSAPRLICPYHRWTYGLDGSLLAAGRMPADFNKGEHSLRPVPLRRVAGAIFICLADDPPEFDSFGQQFEAYAGPLNFANLKLAATDLMVEEANWKLVMENARECYHCPTGHPELGQSFPVQSAQDTVDRDFVEAMDRLGLPHAGVEGSWWQLARFALNAGCSSISMDGQPVCSRPLTTLNGGNVGSLRWAIDPHLFAHATGDHVFVFSCMPVGPRETHVFSRWYVHKDAEEGRDYQIPALKELWLKTNLQDKELAENNHRGVLSPGYRPGPYSLEAERLVTRFADWYCQSAKDYVASHG